MFDLSAIQSALQQFGLDGWLLYDFRGSNILAQRILKMPTGFHGSRRYFYFIPNTGQPRKLVHRIETDVLDHLPGSRSIYLRWQELEAGVQAMVQGSRRVAMEYSPRNGNPYISRVDAGTVELVRSFGCDVISSGDLISLFESVLSEEPLKSHLRASAVTNAAYAPVWSFIARRVRETGCVQESEVCDEIMRHFDEHGLTTYSPPIVGVDANGGNPHYSTGTGSNTTIREGSFVLVDLWAREKPRAPATATSPVPATSAPPSPTDTLRSSKSSLPPATPASPASAMPLLPACPSPALMLMMPSAL